MNISEYLKEAGLTQIEFATLLGVSQGAIAFWLHNKAPTIERAIQIEKVTSGKVTCEELRPDVDWAYLRGTRCEEKVGDGEAVGIVEKIKANQRNFGELPDGSPDPDKHLAAVDTPAEIEREAA